MAKATITPEQLVQQVLQDWAFEVENLLRAELKQRQGYVPEETIRNLQMTVFAAAAGADPAMAFLQFQDSGRHVDMRRLEFRKRAIEQGNNFILDWVKKKGVEKFRFVPGYSGVSRETLSKQKQESRIASAIIASRGSRVKLGSRRRQARWFSRNFYAEVSKLIRMLLDEQANYILDRTKQDLDDAFNNTR